MTMALVSLLKVAFLCLVFVAAYGKPGKLVGKPGKTPKAEHKHPHHRRGNNECTGKSQLYEECDGGLGICFYHHGKPVHGHMVCTAVCGQPPREPNTKPVPIMTQTDPEQMEGATFTYECDVGTASRPGDIMDVHCTHHGSWTSATFQCLHDCGPSIPVSSHQTVESTEGQLLGDHAEIGCEEHYSATTCITAECKADGWHVNGGECVRDCDTPASSVFGNDELLNLDGDTLYGDVAMYHCQSGFASKGSLTLVCAEDGNWVKYDPAAECVKDCGTPASSVFGNDELLNPDGDTLYRDVAMYHCQSGFASKGSLITVCDEDGNWVKYDPAAECVKDCGSTVPGLDFPYNVMSASSGTLEGALVAIGCSTGYSATKCIIASCTPTGWSRSDGVCEKDCHTPDLVVSHAHYPLTDSDTWRNGQYTSYICDSGYVASGNLGVTCDIGTWTRDDPSAYCYWDCGAPVTSLPEHSSVTCQTGHVVGDTVEATCEAGYVTDGEIHAVCVEQVGWQVTGGPCKRDCGAVSATSGEYFNHAHVLQQPVATLEGSTADLACDAGFTLKGNTQQVTCDAGSGQWTPMAESGSCLKECGPVSINLGEYFDYARVTQQPATTTEGSTVDLECDAGFTHDEKELRVKCDASTGRWTPTPGSESCLRICGAVSTTSGEYFNHAHATKLPFIPLEGNTADLACDAGFTLKGNTQQVTCDRDSGQWTPTAESGSCLKDCGPPSLTLGEYFPNAFLEPSPVETTVGSYVDLVCEAGYRVHGRVQIVCSSDTGRWIAVLGQGMCKPDLKECRIPRPGSGEYFPNANLAMPPFGLTEGSTANLACDDGYNQYGEIKIICSPDTGGWTLAANPGRCELGTCLEKNLPKVADASYSLNAAGDTAIYTCNANAVKVGGEGPGISECDEGLWTVPDIECLSITTECLTDVTLPVTTNKAVRYDDDTCFYTLDNRLTWQDAFDTCKSQGATMATIDNARMDTFLVSYTLPVNGPVNHWMPLKYVSDDNGASYYWKDMNTKSPATYFSPYFLSNSIGSSGRCLVFNKHYGWLATFCGSPTDMHMTVCKVMAPLKKA